MIKLQKFNQKVRSSKKMPDLRAGDIVRVHRKVKEGGKERIQVFEGIVISIKGKQSSSPMITVRRVSFGVGVEITVPVFSPVVEKIEVVKKTKVRRSKLYYLRRKDFKLSKLKMKELDEFVVEEKKEKNEEVAGKLDEKENDAEDNVRKEDKKEKEKDKKEKE